MNTSSPIISRMFFTTRMMRFQVPPVIMLSWPLINQTCMIVSCISPVPPHMLQLKAIHKDHLILLMSPAHCFFKWIAIFQIHLCHLSWVTKIYQADWPISGLIGPSSNLCNWLPDSGATKHKTPCLADLKDVEKGLNVGAEVAEDHIICCTTQGKVRIKMTDDNGLPLAAILTGTLCVNWICILCVEHIW